MQTNNNNFPNGFQSENPEVENTPNSHNPSEPQVVNNAVPPINEPNVGEFHYSQPNQPYTYTPTGNMPTSNKSVQNDSKSFGFGLLGYLIPILGIIMYFVKKNETPRRAKSWLNGALISIVVNVILSIIVILCTVISGTALFSTLSKMDTSNPNDIIEELADYSDDYDTAWEEYVVSYNSKSIYMPLYYETVKSMTNCALSNEDENSTISPQSIEYKLLYDSNGNEISYLILKNTSYNEDKPCKECSVVGVKDFTSFNDNATEHFIFPYDLYLGKTITYDQLVETIGEPSVVNDNNSAGDSCYICTYYSNNDKYNRNRFVITITNDIVTEILLSNENF